MPAYSKEREAEFVSRIRLVLTRNPSASVLKVKRTLEGSKNAPLKLDKDYIWKLIKKIQKERTMRLDYRRVSVVLAGFEDEMQEIKRNCWDIIFDPSASDSEKLAAMRELRMTSDTLIQRMFNSGVMERKPKILSPKSKAVTQLAEALKNANTEQRLQFVELVRSIAGKNKIPAENTIPPLR